MKKPDYLVYEVGYVQDRGTSIWHTNQFAKEESCRIILLPPKSIV